MSNNYSELDESTIHWLKKYAGTLTEDEARQLDEAFNNDSVNEKKKILKQLDKMIERAANLGVHSSIRNASDDDLDSAAEDSPETLETDYMFFNELYRILYEWTKEIAIYKKDQRSADTKATTRYSSSRVDLPSPSSHRKNHPDRM